EIRLRLRGGKVRALDRIVELDENIAALDLLVGAEVDLRDDTGRLNRQVDAAAGADGTDCLDNRAPLPRFGLDSRDSHDRDWHVGKEVLDRLIAESVESDEAADYGCKENDRR